MSVISTSTLLDTVEKLRADAVARLVTVLNHDTSMMLRGEIAGYDEVVYKLIEEPRQEAERQALNGVEND